MARPVASETNARPVAADRVISTVDPAMRHGRKTSAHKVDGYKSHQLTQSVSPAAGARLITAVAVTPANAADGTPLPALIVERAALTGAAPAQVMGDTAYGATTVQAAVTGVAPDTTVVAPVPPPGQQPGGPLSQGAVYAGRGGRNHHVSAGRDRGIRGRSAAPPGWGAGGAVGRGHLCGVSVAGALCGGGRPRETGSRAAHGGGAAG